MIRVFVVGSPRAGTTIVQRAIAEHGNLFTHPETQFFMKMVGNIHPRTYSRNRFHEKFWARQKYRTRQALRLSTPRDWTFLGFIPEIFNNRRVPMQKLANAFVQGFDRMAAEHNLAGWIEKTPEHLHYLDEIHRYVPDARIVHIIREGRDVIASRKDAAEVHGGHWDQFYSDLFWNVDRQNTDIARSAEYVDDDRHIFVDYDTFCNCTSAALEVVLEHVGATVSTPGAPKTAPQRFNIAEETEPWKAGAVDGAVEKSTSKWVQVFSEEERTTAEALLAPLPERLAHKLKEFNQCVLALERLWSEKEK
ncbi:sulfotransferase [Rhodosalinus sp. K401]|uniref:sulfotransferase family protein n=1 Tax=Rhodosalinus sp. K401 TaxID=3239195 RepID=UPI0035242836